MKLIIFFISFLFAFSIKAQDPVYILNNRSAIIFNPALTGIKTHKRISTSYQTFWSKYENSPVLVNISFDQKTSKLHGGIGGFISQDYYSIYNRSNLGISYSYQLSINRKLNLSVGINGILTHKKVIPNALTNGNNLLTVSNNYYIRSNIGAFLYGQKMFWGISANNLTSSEIPNHFISEIGYLFSFSKIQKLFITPTLTYSYQDNYQSVLAKLNVTYNLFHLGIGYAEGDNILMMGGVNYKMFEFSYGYNITTSKLTNNNKGTHQVNLIMNLSREKHQNPKLKNSFDTFLF